MTDGNGPVRLIELRRFGDDRGWFAETYSEAAFAARGITARFIQDNQSLSRARYTLRGLHFQTPPHGQAKLVRCLSGRIFDVAVDLRRGSPTYGRSVAAELSADNGRQMYVPVGFAHAFLTLEDDCQVAYKVDGVYAPTCEGGLRWDDPTLGLDWPLPQGTLPQLSDKDAVLPTLAAFDSPFAYDGDPLTPLFE